jgi:hypothetical protein
MSHSRRIDGLWVGCWVRGDLNPSAALDRVEAALGLIKLYDPLRYERLRRDLERIWVNLLPGNWGEFNRTLRMCVLDERFVLAEATRPEQIASTIVHEATHARLMRCGIGYETERRARVEAVCFRRERAFAAKLPDGELARDEAERRLTGYPLDFWTDEGRRNRFDQGMVDGLRYLGVPDFLIRALLGVRAPVRSVRRITQRLKDFIGPKA